jgi:hypothetical protein
MSKRPGQNEGESYGRIRILRCSMEELENSGEQSEGHGSEHWAEHHSEPITNANLPVTDL